jgi:hypothetical protein
MQKINRILAEEIRGLLPPRRDAKGDRELVISYAIEPIIIPKTHQNGEEDQAGRETSATAVACAGPNK